MTAKHDEPVGAALLWTLEQGLGPGFMPPMKAAWTEAYTTLSGAMKGTGQGGGSKYYDLSET